MSTDHDNPATFPHALSILRVGVAVLIGIHGYSRALNGTVPGLGGFLTSQGFPLGLGLAWCITAFEMVGTVCLLLGRFLRLVVPGHIGILLGGIALVHAREGWYVVGGGRNGVEYSVLLITALLTILVASRKNNCQEA